MNKILVLSNHPRKDGYTHRITEMVIQGARDAGAMVNEINIRTKNVQECRGCYRCWMTTPGTCVFEDDAAEINQMILDHDVIICSTPMYHYGISAGMKKVIERTFPLHKQGTELTPRGFMKNSPRYPEQWEGKKLGFIAAGAFKKTGNFEALRLQFALMADGLTMTLCAELLRPEAYLLQFELAKPKTVKTVETALAQAGVELATKGIVSQETQDKVSRPLATDMDHFVKYSGIYWEHAVRLGKEGILDLATVQRSVVGDVRILMSEMARSCDKAASAKLKAVLQFDFPDKDLHFRLSVNKGDCTLEQTTSDTCDLRVTVDTTTWAQAFTREINMRDALMKHLIHLEGDKMLFTRLDKYFPPPVA